MIVEYKKVGQKFRLKKSACGFKKDQVVTLHQYDEQGQREHFGWLLCAGPNDRYNNADGAPGAWVDPADLELVEQTPCEALGYKVGDKFMVSQPGYGISVGEVVELVRDDGTRMPRFASSTKSRWIYLNDVTPYVEVKKTPCEELGYKVGDLFEVTQGPWFEVGSVVSLERDDGSTAPYFKQRTLRYYMSLDSVKPFVKAKTPVEELGYKVGDKFEVISENIGRYPIGTIITLERDDRSERPMFAGEGTFYKNAKGGAAGAYVELSAVKPYVEAVAVPEGRDSGIDWDSAPTGATHYSQSSEHAERWHKLEDGVWSFRHHKGHWQAYDDVRYAKPETQVARPVKVVEKPKTPAEELGYKVGDKFEVVEHGCSFDFGSIITLYRDDNSTCPLFSGPGTRFNHAGGKPGAYLTLEFVKPYVEPVVADDGIDWASAPEGATHYCRNALSPWHKLEDGIWSYRDFSRQNWKAYYDQSVGAGRTYVTKPAPAPVDIRALMAEMDVVRKQLTEKREAYEEDRKELVARDKELSEALLAEGLYYTNF